MKKTLPFAVLFVLVAILSACGKGESANVSVSYADADTLSKYPSYLEYNDDYGETHILIVPDATVYDFKIVNVGFDEVGNDIKLKITDTVYSAEELSPEKPIRAYISLGETIPIRGISYRNKNGEVKSYGLGISGKDGSLILTEIE